uniref:Uncharacterized protein n=1 Tax=Myotis myotis TaxID=51298 RepID=A0A7J7XHG1_MYOMY|nr:hypothetical protein mMyoMyo1_011691 [Myotis myotis]
MLTLVTVIIQSCYLIIIIIIILNIFLLIPERKGEGERDRNINGERDSLIDYLLHAPYWGCSPQPRHVSLTRIEPWTLQFTGDTLSTEPNWLGLVTLLLTYIYYSVVNISVTYLFYNWKFLPLKLL